MLRTALRPRWLIVLVLVLVAAGVMAGLGRWQWDRARQHGLAAQRHLLQRPAVPLGSVLLAREPFGSAVADRPVTATGRWDPAHQLLVVRRTHGTGSSSNPGSRPGTLGWWVLTPLRLADGSAVPVVRGWVPSPADPRAAAAAVPAGPVRITGVLEPAEPAQELPPGQGTGLPAGQLDRVAVTELVQLWPYPLLTGYIVAGSQLPVPAAGSPDPVQVVPVSGGLALQNLAYAVQWFLFAGLGLFFWWRLVRDDWRRRTAGAALPDAAAPPDAAPQAGPAIPAPVPPDATPAPVPPGQMGDDGRSTTAARGAHP